MTEQRMRIFLENVEKAKLLAVQPYGLNSADRKFVAQYTHADEKTLITTAVFNRMHRIVNPHWTGADLDRSTTRYGRQ